MTPVWTKPGPISDCKNATCNQEARRSLLQSTLTPAPILLNRRDADTLEQGSPDRDSHIMLLAIRYSLNLRGILSCCLVCCSCYMMPTYLSQYFGPMTFQMHVMVRLRGAPPSACSRLSDRRTITDDMLSSFRIRSYTSRLRQAGKESCCRLGHDRDNSKFRLRKLAA